MFLTTSPGYVPDGRIQIQLGGRCERQGLGFGEPLCGGRQHCAHLTGRESPGDDYVHGVAVGPGNGRLGGVELVAKLIAQVLEVLLVKGVKGRWMVAVYVEDAKKTS